MIVLKQNAWHYADCLTHIDIIMRTSGKMNVSFVDKQAWHDII